LDDALEVDAADEPEGVWAKAVADTTAMQKIAIKVFKVIVFIDEFMFCKDSFKVNRNSVAIAKNARKMNLLRLFYCFYLMDSKETAD